MNMDPDDLIPLDVISLSMNEDTCNSLQGCEQPKFHSGSSFYDTGRENIFGAWHTRRTGRIPWWYTGISRVTVKQLIESYIVYFVSKVVKR